MFLSILRPFCVKTFTYEYVNQTSRLRTVTYPASTGLSTNYSYFDHTHPQDFERLQTIQNMSGATQLSKFDYTYNAVGTIATWAQQTSAPTGTYTLSYDNADQLTNAVQTLSGTTVASNAYNYDPAGNRLSETTLTGTTVGAFNNLNQLSGMTTGTLTTSTVSGYTSTPVGTVTVSDVTGHPVTATVTSGTNFSASVAMPPGTNIFSVVATPTGTSYPVTTQKLKVTLSGTMPTSLTYDANGNTLTDEHGNSYTWDALNRLTKISYSAGGYSTFAYDGLSRRIQIVDNLPSGTTTKNYLWIGSEIAEERDASNTATKRFFPQGEQQTISGTTTAYYYTRDHLGSVREMCSSTGTITSRMDYDPYGYTTIVSGTVLPTKQYAGYYQHRTSGLSLTKNRAYDSSVGRWLSRDPIKERGGLNLYEYCRDDATNITDPLGLTGTSITITITPQSVWDKPYGPKNSTVHITATSDCCRDIKFIQYTVDKTTLDDFSDPYTPRLDNIYSSDSYYANQAQTGNGTAQMDDAPGPGAEGDHLVLNTLARIKALFFGLSQEFVTCAICQDAGRNHNKILQCVHWQVNSNGILETASAGPYTGN